MNKLVYTYFRKIISCILTISAVVCGFYCPTKAADKLPSSLDIRVLGTNRDSETSNNKTSYTIGDCIIITYGDTEILVDSSNSAGVLTDIKETMREDSGNLWDYVIFTHPDNDHIGKASAFFQLLKDNEWEVGNVIDFGWKKYTEYVDRNDIEEYGELVKKSKCNYFSAASLSPENKVKEYEISTEPNIRLQILYNENLSNLKREDAENKTNDMSVCFLLLYNNQKMLFTGDLPRTAENALVRNHGELIRDVTFFKAGHHGSNTSNGQQFVDWIRPAYVSITYNPKIKNKMKCASINAFLKYTDYIFPTYVESAYDDSVTRMLFGTCKFSFDGKSVVVDCEANTNTETEKASIYRAKLEGEIWLSSIIENGTEALLSDDVYTYVFDENSYYCFEEDKVEYIQNPLVSASECGFNCTLIKHGHYDVVIDCGSENQDSSLLAEKLKHYVVDGVIECLIISHYHYNDINQLLGSNGVFYNFKIDKVVDNKNSSLPDSGVYGKYCSAVTGYNRTSLEFDDNIELNIGGMIIDVYGSCCHSSDNEDNYSLLTIIKFRGEKMAFVGDLSSYENFNSRYGSNFKNVGFLRFSNSYSNFTYMKGLDKFIERLNPKVVFFASPLGHKNTNGQIFLDSEATVDIMNYIRKYGNNDCRFYSCGYISLQTMNYLRWNGDLAYVIRYFGEKDIKIETKSCVSKYGIAKQIPVDINT